MSLVAAKPKDTPPFLRLPAELRLEIYRLLLTGRTIHIECSMKSMSTRRYELFYNECTANDAMKSLSNLTGASHSHDQSSATSHGTWEPCSSTRMSETPECSDPVRLDVRLLHVCREIYNEAAMLPYAETHFILSYALSKPFREPFVAQFSLEKRSAMQTVAMVYNVEEYVGLVASLLPGLKKLWFDIDFVRAYHPDLTLAASQSKRVAAYSQIKLSHLVGVKVKYDGRDAKNEVMEERLELALLGKQPL